jgi:hypothetical protein
LKLNRKFNRRHPKMRKLIFPAQEYILEHYTDTQGKQLPKTFLKAKGATIGIVELLWTVLIRSPAQDLTKKDLKTIKSVKVLLKNITRYKDCDEDSRVSIEGSNVLILEEEQYEIIKKLMEAFKFTAAVSDEVVDLWDIIDNAESFTPIQSV